MLSDPVPTQGLGGGFEGELGGRMREGTEQNCNVVYGLLYHRTVSPGMGGGQDKDGGVIWRVTCNLERT